MPLGKFSMRVCLYWTLLLLFLLRNAVGAAKWQSGSVEDICTCVFRQSKREQARIGQEDPLFLWLGRPSKALHVGGKHGPIPIPSVWVHFVNVLYVSTCAHDNSSESYAAALSTFLENWVSRNEKYRGRRLYLTGSHDDITGGMHILTAALQIAKSFDLSGVIIGNPTFTPSVQFFRHQSFEQANNMTFWSIDRARQPIVCNGLFSQVEFWMRDVHLKYTPTLAHPTASFSSSPPTVEVAGSYEYDLAAVHTYDTCYTGHDGVSEFENVWSRRPPPLYGEMHPTLPYGTDDAAGKIDPFATPCDAENFLSLEESQCMNKIHTLQEKDATGCCGNRGGAFPSSIKSLLHRGIPIVLYSQLYQSPKSICSFYIGIFEADAMRLPDLSRGEIEDSSGKGNTPDIGADDDHTNWDSCGQATSVYEAFSRASLEEMDSAFTHQSTATAPIAYIQDGTISTNALASDTTCGRKQPKHSGVVWIQLDSRYGAGRTSGGSAPLSRATAVDILAYALGKDHRQDANSDILEVRRIVDCPEAFIDWLEAVARSRKNLAGALSTGLGAGIISSG